VEQLILAEGCDLTRQTVCAPADVKELFEYRTPLFEIAGFPVTRTVVLIFLAAVLIMLLLYFGLRRRARVPGRFGLSVESLMGFVRDEVAIGIIGPEGSGTTRTSSPSSSSSSSGTPSRSRRS
jgi:F0F1-type ATP synthase, subunit a